MSKKASTGPGNESAVPRARQDPPHALAETRRQAVRLLGEEWGSRPCTAPASALPPPVLLDLSGAGVPGKIAAALRRLVPDLIALGPRALGAGLGEGQAICLLWLGNSDRIGTKDLEQAIASLPSVRLVVLAEPPIDTSPALSALAATGRLQAVLAMPLEPGRLCAILEDIRTVARLEASARRSRPQDPKSLVPPLLGDSPAMRSVCDSLDALAQSDTPIFFPGESGTGKEQAARRLHALAARAREPFVAVNCAALPPCTVDSVLFGSEATGLESPESLTRTGRLRAAGRGTLFLKGIHCLPLSAQARLLSLLARGSAVSGSGAQSGSLAPRLILADDQDLRAAVREGTFCPQLEERLLAVALRLPPLRCRGRDIELLAAHFLKDACIEQDRPKLAFSAAALEALRRHSWPGNVTELCATVRRAAVLADGTELRPRDLGLSVPPTSELPTLGEARQACEVRLIREALLRSGNNVRKASEMLGVSRVALYKMLKRYGLTPPASRDSEGRGLDDAEAQA